MSQCLKITEKVSFNIASEANYVYIIPKIVNLASFWKSEACGQTVLPDRSLLISQKLVENAKMAKIQMRHVPILNETFFLWFLNTVLELPERDHDWVLDSFCQGRAKSQYGSDYWRATGYQSWAWGRLLQQLLQLCDICRTHRVCTGFAHPWSW